MPDAWGNTRLWMVALWLAAVTVLASSWGTSAAAQQSAQDTEAREYFERGRVAFENADYERALVYFRHAYRLSERPELQYNIGVAADRLQREEEALDAFERYLQNTEQPVREAEVRERIDALRESIEQQQATERALAQAKTTARVRSDTTTTDRSKLPKSTIAGGSALAAVGAAGVTAMAVGLARDGACSEESGGACVTQSSATSWTYVYGAIGIAALAGSATWFAIGHRKSKSAQRETVWSLTPSGVMVSGKF